MGRKEENGENEQNEDQEKQDKEVYVPFLDDLIVKLIKGDPVKNAKRITSLSGVVKALNGDGVSQSLRPSARKFVRQLHKAVHAKDKTLTDSEVRDTVSDDTVSTTGCCREHLSNPSTSAAPSDQTFVGAPAGPQSSDNGEVVTESCIEQVNEISTSLATCHETSTCSSETSRPRTCDDGMELDESTALNKDNAVEHSSKGNETEESVENVTKRLSCVVTVEKSDSNMLGNDNMAECIVRDNPNPGLEGICAVSNVDSARGCSSEMKTWSTPAKLDIGSPSMKECGPENQLSTDIAPITRDCLTSPKESFEAETSKPSMCNRGKRPTLEFMEWKFIPIDGICTKQSVAQRAERPSGATGLDPRCSGSSLPTDETPKVPQLDGDSLKSLVNWVMDKNERGEAVHVPLQTPIPDSANGNKIDSVIAEPKSPSKSDCAELSPRSDSKQQEDKSDDDCIITGFYRDARPFHLTHKDKDPVVPPEFGPILLKSEAGTDAKSRSLPLQGLSSFPPGNHTKPRPGANDDDGIVVDMDEERVSTGPRIARRKIHDRYDEIVDDWTRRDEKGRAEEMEKRKLRERLERERSEKERERERERSEKERKEQERTRQQRDMNAARMNHNFVNPNAQHNGCAHHCNANQQPLPFHCYNSHLPNPYPPCQHAPPQYMPQPCMPASPHVHCQNPYTHPPIPTSHGPVINPMFPMYPNSHNPMLTHHTPILPKPTSALLPTFQTALLPTPPALHQPNAHSSTLPNHQGPIPSHHQASGGMRSGMTDKTGTGIPQSNVNGRCTDGSQLLPVLNGPLSSCKHCEYVGSNLEVVAHYVNVHPSRFPPVNLSQSELKDAQKELSTETSHLTRQETGIRWLDDLSWIPAGCLFMDELLCKLCPYKGKIRASFIQHIMRHREEELAKLPRPAPPMVVFNCLFCDYTATEINVFYNHITGHTGEFMFKCSKCNYHGHTNIAVKVHNSQDHPKKEAAVIPSRNKRVLEGSVLDGFGCTLCGFVQLTKKNVESHITREHNGKGTVVKINMSRSNNKPRPPPPERRSSVTNKASSQHHSQSMVEVQKVIAVPRRAPPVKVKGDPRTALDRPAVKDLATPPSQLKKVTRSFSQSCSSRSPKKSASKPNSITKAVQSESSSTSNLKSYSIPKKIAPKPPSNKSPASAPAPSAEGTSSGQLEANDSGTMDDSSMSMVVTAMDLPRLMPPAKEAVIVQHTSEFASNIIIKSDGETVGCLTMELEIGEVTNAEPAYDDADAIGGIEVEPESRSGLNVKQEKDDGPHYESDDSDDTVEMNFDEAPGQNGVAQPTNQDAVMPQSSEDAALPLPSKDVVLPPASKDSVLPPASEDSVLPPPSEDTVLPPQNQEVIVPASKQLVSALAQRVIKMERPSFDDTCSIPSIADTILKLQVQLHQEPSGDAASVSASAPPDPEPSSEAPPVFYTNSSSQKIRISGRRLKDWNERRKVLICGCLFAARSTEAFTKHREHWHKGEKRATCPECNSKFDSAADYAEHLWRTCPRSGMRMYACSVEPLCRFTTSSQLHFITHVKEEHAGIEWLPCYWCGKQYTTSDCLAAHLHNQCTIKIPMLRALQNSVAGAHANPVGAEYRGEACSPEEPVAPHLEVVYRCYIASCQHESLEREVFIDHIQVDHPERKEHGCFHCNERFGSIYSLVLHIEDKHREGISDASVCTAAPDQVPSPVASTSGENSGRSNLIANDSSPAESTISTANPCISALLVNQNNVSSAIQMPAHIVIPALIPAPSSALPLEETQRGYEWCSSKRMQVNELLRMLSLSYEIISTVKLDEAQLRENLNKWLDIYWLQKGHMVLAMKRYVDPLVFASEVKTEAAMRAMLDDWEKLAHLYKCAARECTFTCNSENEFREHLLLDKCRTNNWLYCLYCGERHKTVRGAVSHISQRHMLCVHQCPHCIYRTKNKGYLMFHIARVHEQDKGPMVRLMTCPAPRPVDLEDELPDLFSLSVPVACAVDGCAFVTLDPLSLINHHREAHGDASAISCYHCMESFALNEIEKHFQQHQIFNIQCRYCSYGTCVPADVIVHLCSIHPNRTGRIVLRECSQPPIAPAERNGQSSSAIQPPPQVRIKQEPVDHDENENPTASTSRAAGDPVLASASRGPSNVTDTTMMPSTSRDPATPAQPAPPAAHVVAPTESNRHYCGYQPCRYSSNRLRELDEHLTECSRRYVSDLLYCKQCYSSFRDPATFLEHLRSHLAKIFICGLCNHNTQLPHYMKSHLRAAHNLAFEDTKCKLRFPDSDSLSETAEYIYEPVVPKLVIRQDPTGNAGLTSEVAPATAVSKSSVPEDLEVDDVDSIPTQSIFVHPLKCRHCDYSNKVRQNLIRHVEQCKRDRASKTAPETVSNNESAGAACISNSSACDTASVAVASSLSSAAAPADNANPSLRIWHPRQAPKYVNVKERFRCCIGDCMRLESDSESYEAHITSAHADALQLPCPHCSDEFADISDFHLHIQLHGPNLFRCWYCTYHHYHRNLITGHCLDQHPGVPALVRTLRQEHEIDVPDNSLVSNWRRSREESSSRVSASSAVDDGAVAGPSHGEANEDNQVPLQLAFSCKTCKTFTTSSKSSMRAHLIEELELETYSCSRCPHTCHTSVKIQEHFRSSHDGEIPDFQVSMDHRHEALLSQLLESQAENLRTLDQLSMVGGGGNNNNSNEERPSAFVYPCPKCIFSHPAKSFARSHILGHLQKQNNKCKVCRAQYSRLQHLRRHHLAAHPKLPFVSHKEKDIQIETFVDWVLKRLEDGAYGDANIPRPIPLTCLKNDCLMIFNDLKKFNEHFKKHVHHNTGLQRGASSSAAVLDGVAPGTSTDLNLIEDRTEDDSRCQTSARFELRCPYCDFKHAVKANVRRHILRHYDFKFYLCGHCAHEGLEHKDVVYHCRDNHPGQSLVVIEKRRPETLELRQVSNRRLVVVNMDKVSGSCPTERNGRFQCSECLFSTSNFLYARYHCQNRHPRASVLKAWRGDPSAVPDNQLPATESDTTADGEQVADVIEQEQECTMCHERLLGPKAYLDHVMLKHSCGVGADAKKGKAKRKKGPLQTQPAAKRVANSSSSSKGSPKDVVAHRCKVCEKLFREMVELRTHFNVFHPVLELTHEDVLREEMYSCPKCSFASVFYDEAKQHVLRAHLKAFRCGLCFKPVFSSDGVLRHSRFKHPQEPAVPEKNPCYREQRIMLLRQLKRSPCKRRDASPAPGGNNNDEVAVIEIEDDDVVEEVFSLPVSSINSSMPASDGISPAPESRYPDLPAVSHVHCPSPSHVHCPSPSHVDCPSPSHVDCPTPAHVGGPSPAHVGCPSPAHVDCPTPAHVGGPSPAHVGGPSPAHVGCPSPADVGCPSPAHVGCPSPSHVGCPSSSHGDGPSPKHGDGPSPSHGDGPSPKHVDCPSPEHVDCPSLELVDCPLPLIESIGQNSPVRPAEFDSPAPPLPSNSSSPARAVAKKSTSSSLQSLSAKKRGKKRKMWGDAMAVWHPKRINLEEQFPDGFSYYGFKPEKIDVSKLIVFTNFRGLQNANVRGEHLCEVFNMFPKVLLTDCCSNSPE